MGNLLEKIQAPKFLRYLFFIAYSWYRKYTSERSDAHNTAILLVSIGYMILFAGFFWNIIESEALQFVSTFGSTGLVMYFLFYHKKKWKRYLDEFKYVKRKQQRIGLIYLFAYLFACLFVSVFKIIFYSIFNIRIEDYL